MIRIAFEHDVDERLAVERQRDRAAHLGIVERRALAVDDQVGGDVGLLEHAHRVGRLRLHVLQQRDRDLGREGDVELAGDEAEDRGRAVRHDRVFDAVEIGQALLPVVRVLRQLDRLVLLQLDELERPGADRIGALRRRRDVAGIDRRVAGREHREDRRLRARQMERRLQVAFGRDFLDVGEPVLARVLAEAVLRFAGQHLEGALHVGAGERLAVMPLHAFAQLEGERLAVRAPLPARGELGDDRLDAVLRLVLVVDHQVAEDRHRGDVDRIGRFLVDRHARRVLAVIHPQDAAGFGLLRIGDRRGGHRERGDRQSEQRLHPFPSRAVAGRVARRTRFYSWGATLPAAIRRGNPDEGRKRRRAPRMAGLHAARLPRRRLALPLRQPCRRAKELRKRP